MGNEVSNGGGDGMTSANQMAGIGGQNQVQGPPSFAGPIKNMFPPPPAGCMDPQAPIIPGQGGGGMPPGPGAGVNGHAPGCVNAGTGLKPPAGFGGGGRYHSRFLSVYLTS